MNPKLHDLIVGKLETIKATGLISDYLVSWVGSRGKLEPTVRTWSNSEPALFAARQTLAQTLLGMVAEHNIRVTPVATRIAND